MRISTFKCIEQQEYSVKYESKNDHNFLYGVSMRMKIACWMHANNYVMFQSLQKYQMVDGLLKIELNTK